MRIAQHNSGGSGLPAKRCGGGIRRQRQILVIFWGWRGSAARVRAYVRVCIFSRCCAPGPAPRGVRTAAPQPKLYYGATPPAAQRGGGNDPGTATHQMCALQSSNMGTHSHTLSRTLKAASLTFALSYGTHTLIARDPSPQWFHEPIAPLVQDV